MVLADDTGELQALKMDQKFWNLNIHRLKSCEGWSSWLIGCCDRRWLRFSQVAMSGGSQEIQMEIVIRSLLMCVFVCVFRTVCVTTDGVLCSSEDQCWSERSHPQTGAGSQHHPDDVPARRWGQTAAHQLQINHGSIRHNIFILIHWSDAFIHTLHSSYTYTTAVCLL